MNNVATNSAVPSAAKGIGFVILALLLIVPSGRAQTKQNADVSTLAGTWLVHFNKKPGNRVYRISEDGTMSFADAYESKSGTILNRNGDLISEVENRIFRFTKLSETMIKVEAFNPKSRYETGKPSSVATGRLETPPGQTKAPAAPPATLSPQVAEKEPSPSTIAAPIKTSAIVLAPGWDSPMQGGSNTMDDLGKLFGGLAKPGVTLEADSTINVYDGVPYLTPFPEALIALRITSRPASKNQIACPGLPRGSLFYYAVDGRFEGSYNRMYVVVDRADQVVSVQLVNETPKQSIGSPDRDTGWRAYNFVNARTKANSRLHIEHKLFYQDKDVWGIPDSRTSGSRMGSEIGKTFRLDTRLLSRDERSYNTYRVLEQVRWYVPKHLAELILTCVQNGAR